jgi:DNA-directed RNA polymerase specialized sigma24 family protein
MGHDSLASTDAGTSPDELFQSLVCEGPGRGEALRTQLAARYPDCSADEIEEAIQYACKSFLDEAEGIGAPGQVYAWIRTAALRSLGREADRHHREVVVDPGEDGLEGVGAQVAGPIEELIEIEDDADLELLVTEVSSSLSERRRDVLALHGAGIKRSQIAERLGLPERVVKRDIEAIMDEARATLARLAGGGCERGEPLVMRLLCGISDPVESAQAREHLSDCARCGQFSERLIAWREKAGAMLPAPVAEGASPGVLGRIAESSTERLAALKQHVLDGGAQIKQHATTTYYRAVDPTPLAAARPGTAAAVIASCIAIGGGAATYCVEQGVDPLGAAKGLIASAPEEQPEPTTPQPEPESTGPTYTPAETPVVEEPAPTPEPAPQPEPESQQKQEPPPPEDSFEPVSPAYASSEGGSEETYEAPEAAPVESTQSEPAPAQPGPQFGGP